MAGGSYPVPSPSRVDRGGGGCIASQEMELRSDETHLCSLSCVISSKPVSITLKLISFFFLKMRFSSFLPSALFMRDVSHSLFTVSEFV